MIISGWEESYSRFSIMQRIISFYTIGPFL